MNKTILWAGGILAILNVLIGMIVSTIGAFTIITTSIIIILTTVILLWLNGNGSLKDGFKVSLNFIIPLIGIMEYLFAIFMPNRFADNWCLILIFLLLTFENLILLIAKFISNKVE